MTIFDREASRKAADDAIERVRDNADTDWLECAIGAVAECATRYTEFTTDDVWFTLIHRDVERPREPRALGAVMRIAVKNRFCEPTPNYKQSDRVACHSRPLRVWRSLLR